jgi:hypothetical protein
MRDYKQIGVRLSKHEATFLERLACDKELTVSELVRMWLERAAREVWREQQQGKRV